MNEISQFYKNIPTSKKWYHDLFGLWAGSEATYRPEVGLIKVGYKMNDRFVIF